MAHPITKGKHKMATFLNIGTQGFNLDYLIMWEDMERYDGVTQQNAPALWLGFPEGKSVYLYEKQREVMLAYLYRVSTILD